MCFRVFTFLIGAVFILCQLQSHGCSQSSSTGHIYIAELMVESNVTLEAQTLLSILNSTTDLTVKDESGSDCKVTILKSEVAADCLIIGETSSCNCSNGFTWSNEVCDATQCCRDTTCKKNVSYITPLCIPKVQVKINGSVTLKTSAAVWDGTKAMTLQTAIEKMNGLESFNITENRSQSVDFEAVVSVKFEGSRLQHVVTAVENGLSAVVWVDTLGLVTINTPGSTVKYDSTVELNCTYEEVTDSAGWNMSRPNQRFELNNGTVVKVNSTCAIGGYSSCAAVTIQRAAGLWEGTYECGFMQKSVRHIAKAYLSVALLPDDITLTIDPPTVDCSTSSETDTINVKVSATIQNSSEHFDVHWSFMGKRIHVPGIEFVNDSLVYSFMAPIQCKKTTEAQYANVTFENRIKQIKSARVDIPVIYEGEKFCEEDDEEGVTWPKTPGGATLINRTCPEGRVGYKSRTCGGSTWEPVFSSCVKEELNKVFNEADKFKMGLGATQAVAMDIFGGLKNSSSFSSDSSDTTADISASINILSVMAEGSQNVALEEEVFPDLVGAASNMLNSSWAGVNKSVVHKMSSAYLESVEGLVKNIKVKHASTVTSNNLDLKFCMGEDCNVTTFDISVSLNKTSGIIKTVAVKNIMNKLRNNFHKTTPSSLLLSATLDDNQDSSLQITLDFPTEDHDHQTPLCVFWDTTVKDWSKTGCTVKTNEGNRTSCECNHLTSFSVLMAKTDMSTDILDMITNVGLGVSVCSLLIFLIIESLVWSAVVKTNLSHFRHTAIVNIAVFLLLANCCFLASSFPDKISDSMCLVMTVCKHLFYLAMFSWMLCMSVMLVHQLIFVFSPLRKRVFMFLSSIVGYVCPILIVGCSYVYAKYTDKPYYKRETCWLVYEKLLDGSIHAFLLPVGTVILTNLFSMVVVIVTLMKSSVPDSKSEEKDALKSILKVVIFLTPVFGVTWVIGFFLLILDDNDPMLEVTHYCFVILNSFQGLFILITGCIAEQKVREELWKLIMDKSKGKNTSTKNFNSTTYTKDK